MSALTGATGAHGPDGIARYRTKVKVIVNSHHTDQPIDLSDSVININTNKNIKSVGQLSFALTGERNWFNVLYPNDYVNLYIDRGDGAGWVRTFFGFVDHIEQLVQVNSGKPSTVYSIQCSDFQKALERTQIYFNPHVAARADFNGGFIGTPNIGGLALMTRGIRVNGSPADLAINVILLLLGFGSQFVLPSSYNPLLATRIRQQRADFILNKLSEDARRQVLDAGGYAAFLERERNRQGIQTDTLDLINPDSTNASDIQRAERARLSNEIIETLGGAGSGVATETHIGARERGVEAYNVLNTTVQGYPPTLLDVIDIFTFVERTAIDGYTIGAPMWEHQGSVMSFLRSISNEVVNELFFDLRPISRGGGLQAGVAFSMDRDDIGGNLPSHGVPGGQQYLPAMIMREYPFSTIHSVDGGDISLTIREQTVPGGAAAVQGVETLGLLHFGAIFSNEPNVPGRHIVHIPNINPEDRARGLSTQAAVKHLDTVVVYDHELKQTRFSRSDTDHYNLFEFYSDSLLGQHARFFMQDLLPIITPIHIVQHGLRVRSLTTRFGRFSLDVVNRVQPQEAPPSEEQPEEATPQPAPSNPEVVLPVEVTPTQGYVTQANRWWYRPKKFDGVRHYNNAANQPVPPANTRYWRFHNGVDIRTPRGAPVRAVRDGRVVMAAPVGTNGRAGYGNVVMIYHPDVDMYSLYAHLDDFADNLKVASRSRNLIHFVSTDLRANGRYEPVEVRAGDVIGFAGNSDCEGVHLHFEFNKTRNNRTFPSSLDRRSLTPDIFRDTAVVPGALVSSGRPTNPDESRTISQDPVRVFAEWGVVLPVGPDEVQAATPGDDPPDEAMYPGDEAEDTDADSIDSAPTPNEEVQEQEDQVGQSSTVSVGHVDTPSTRRQIARWALLNDHWYQHNLEYLSGTIEMRGAPEIRVGYRLDLADRNMSFYVEGVSHSWSYGGEMSTTLQVTRGQPNNPYPSYVYPHIEGFTPTDTQRRAGSRLSKYFIVPDPISVRRALKVSRGAPDASWRNSPLVNSTDSPGSYAASLSAKYDERIQEAESVGVNPDMEEALSTIERPDTFGTSTATTTTNPLGGVDGDVVAELFPTLEDL